MESNTENGGSLEERRDAGNGVEGGRGAERSDLDFDSRDFERRRRIVHRRRRGETSILDHRLQMPMEIAAPLGRLAAMTAGGAVLRWSPELRGNASGGARRIQQEGKDEDQRHGPLYSGGQVTMES